MILFLSNQVRELREIGFQTEKEMQKNCEQNMDMLLGIQFMASEFRVAQFRFDSVAYNKNGNTFMIIEYKNDKNFSVVDQGYSYISTLLNHKADFVLKYNQVFHANRGLEDFDWTQVRVLFIAPSYTVYQMNSINFSDLPMELWKIKRYENGILSFEQIKPMNTSASISGYVSKTISTSEKSVFKKNDSRDEKEVIVYTEDDRLEDGTDTTRELYLNIKDYILSLDDEITIKPTKLYIGFLYHNHNLVDIKLQKNSIIVWLNTEYGKLDDPMKVISDVTHKGHHGNGNCQIKLSGKENIGYIKDLILSHYQNQISDSKA